MEKKRYNAVPYEKILHIIAGTDAVDQSESEPKKTPNTSP